MLLFAGKAIGRDGIFAESVALKAPDYAGCMLRTDRWKYNHYLDGVDELYDLVNDPHETKNLVSDTACAGVAGEMKKRIVSFWKPEEQLARYAATPRLKKEKHFYPYSNQFIIGNGKVFDARP